MKAFVLYPTYVLAQIMQPFLPEKHPWKDRLPDYDKWVRNSTEMNVQFGVVFTLSFFQLCFMAWYLFL
jgi:hypothetical protein